MRALQLALPGLDKRWRDRRERWVAPGDVFHPREYSVDVIAGDARPKAFVVAHHYAGSFPAARLSVGLFGPGPGGHPALAGVAVFSVGVTHDGAAAKYCGGTPDAVAELGRFVCAPSVRFNGESWFLARAFPLVAREKGISGVYSYADPMERTTAAGLLTKRAHWGTIYQASNALHVGRASPRTVYVAADGTIVNGRALTKIRKQEQGCDYAAAQLVALGAPPRASGEDPDAWVRRALHSGAFRRLRHPGNLVYVFGLDAACRATLRAMHGAGLAYPQRAA